MEAKRTLVKSPPELWAEVSDVAALARHLGEFGEIRITRTEPEAVVEWEGDRASGSVILEPSGWGTKVTLIAEVPEPEPPPEPPPAPEPVAAAPRKPTRFAWLAWWRRSAPPAPEPEPEPGPAAPAPPPAPQVDTAAVLDGVLDRLGSAHHRPFSR